MLAKFHCLITFNTSIIHMSTNERENGAAVCGSSASQLEAVPDNVRARRSEKVVDFGYKVRQYVSKFLNCSVLLKSVRHCSSPGPCSVPDACSLMLHSPAHKNSVPCSK